MKGMPHLVKMHLEKARDSALLAVEVYNKPAVKFKSAAYISLMYIAWTALFHSIFFKRKIKPFYKNDKSKKFEKIDGDYKHWELCKCLEQYFKQDVNNPIRKNIEFFIPLRNKIEHRHLPELDSNIFAECQSLLLNFDEILENEYGTKFCLRECLSFALQMFPNSSSFNEAFKRNKEVDEVLEFINSYRSMLSQDVVNSGKYSFKAYLIKVANHHSKDALPIQFVNFDELTEEQKQNMNQFIVALKEKSISVANKNLLKPGEVVKEVLVKLENPKVIKKGVEVDILNLHTHQLLYQKYNVRPKGKSKTPEATNLKYCIYDKAHKDYLYTNEWVKFLVEKLSDSKEYDSLYTKISG